MMFLIIFLFMYHFVLDFLCGSWYIITNVSENWRGGACHWFGQKPLGAWAPLVLMDSTPMHVLYQCLILSSLVDEIFVIYQTIKWAGRKNNYCTLTLLSVEHSYWILLKTHVCIWFFGSFFWTNGTVSALVARVALGNLDLSNLSTQIERPRQLLAQRISYSFTALPASKEYLLTNLSTSMCPPPVLSEKERKNVHRSGLVGAIQSQELLTFTLWRIYCTLFNWVLIWWTVLD